MNIQTLPDQKEIEEILGLGGAARKRRWLSRLVWLALGVVLLAGSVWWYQSAQSASTRITYETVPAKRANLIVSVTATGTIEPTTQIDVSSEMSGVVRVVNVGNNSLIKKGDVLAELDTERFAAQLRSMQASVGGAKAKLVDAQATLLASNLTLTRKEALVKKGFSASQDYESAKASQARAQAAIIGAEADILIANANLELKQLDIDKSKILSPVDGIVLKRAVELGQTVASSLQAPVLFTLAEDLKRMQLEANIDEADIGAVKLGQSATFAVDAFPGRSFPARIETIEFSPETTDGVVTYKAILSVDNADLALRPGMTATALITVQDISNALLVPNAALRYSPPVVTKQENFSLTRMFMPRMPRSTDTIRKPAGSGERTLWILKDAAPQSVVVSTGATDGKMTEVVKGDLTEGTPLVTGSRAAGKK
jgi:HlyD family secretion protein